MAKAKQKECSFCVIATEVSKDRWSFKTDHNEWEYLNQMGLNLFHLHQSGEKTAVAYFKSLDAAVNFAVGWDSGREYEKNLQEAEKKA